jgi:hypothetical protein
MKHRLAWATLAFPLLAALSVADPPAEKKATPEPPEVPLKVRLIARKATYVLDLGGRTPKQYRKAMEKADGAVAPPVPAPAVDLVLEVRNTGGKEIKLWDAGFRGGSTRLELDLKGPGAAKISVTGPPVGANIPPRAPREVVLKPGKTYSMPIKSLAVLDQYRAGLVSYWTDTGEYTLKARFHTAISPAPRGAKEPVWMGPPMVGVDPKARAKGFGQVTLTSDPVKLKVVKKK